MFFKYSQLLCLFFSSFSVLNSDFFVNIGEVFSIKIIKWPESLKLQVFESKLFNSNLISEVFIPFPDIDNISSIEKYNFTSNQKLSYNHSAVGSGLYNSSKINAVHADLLYIISRLRGQ